MFKCAIMRCYQYIIYKGVFPMAYKVSSFNFGQGGINSKGSKKESHK